MGRDLPEPAALSARWGAVAAAFAAVGWSDVWWVDGRGAHYDDGGGNDCELLPVEGGRALLVGYDHEYSGTAWASPPLDLLAGAPVWIPWGRAVERAERDSLGYAYWYEDGAWSRVPYPDSVSDGLEPTAGRVFTEESTVRTLVEVVFEWAEHDSGQYDENGRDRDEPAVVAAAGALLAAAHARTVDESLLAALLGRITSRPVDLAAGVEAATRAGITPAAPPPVFPAGTAEPQRRVRVLSDEQLSAVRTAAMRAAEEFPRPEPDPTPELAALVDWMRSRAPGGDGRCSVLLQIHDRGGRQVFDDLAPERSRRRTPGEPDAFGLAQALREAEAHPRHGRWSFLRVGTTATGYEVERHYDSVPAWARDRLGAPSGMAAEAARRSPEFRPAWTVLLDDSIAYTGVPAPYDRL